MKCIFGNEIINRKSKFANVPAVDLSEAGRESRIVPTDAVGTNCGCYSNKGIIWFSNRDFYQWDAFGTIHDFRILH